MTLSHLQLKILSMMSLFGDIYNAVRGFNFLSSDGAPNTPVGFLALRGRASCTQMAIMFSQLPPILSQCAEALILRQAILRFVIDNLGEPQKIEDSSSYSGEQNLIDHSR